MHTTQLIRLLDVAPLNSVSNAQGVSPRSLRITGKDFRSVEQVLINGIASPEFVVMSSTDILAQVPEAYEDSPINEVVVLSSSLTLTERSLVEFTFGTRPKKVEGVTRMMQNFLRILLRSPGSNIFHKNSGGGLLRRVGRNLTSRAAADVHIAVNLTKEYIVRSQSATREIPNNERLLEAEITALTPDAEATALYVTIVLTNHAGQRAGATLVA